MKHLFSNKKLLIYQICFMALSISFSSCNNNELEIDTRPTLGYFDGTVNGKHIKLDEKDLKDLLLHHDGSGRGDNPFTAYFFSINIPSEIIGESQMSIAICLSPLSCQSYEFGPTYDPEFPHKYISLAYKNVIYKPALKPFKIEIDTIISDKENPNIIWSSPRISGHMEGVLHNIQNPQDSIVITNAKFRVWNNYV